MPLSKEALCMQDMNRGELLLVLYSMLELQKNGLTESATRVMEKTIAQLEKESLKEEKANS